MNENSVVLRKNIIDHIQKNNLDPGSIIITMKLIKSVKAVCWKYQVAIEEEKNHQKEIEQIDQLKILNNEIQEIKKKKGLPL